MKGSMTGNFVILIGKNGGNRMVGLKTGWRVITNKEDYVKYPVIRYAQVQEINNLYFFNIKIT